MADPHLSVVIPAWNEANRLPLTLADIDRYLEGVTYSYEVLVVDDGSRDRTADIVEQLAEVVPHLRLVRSGGNEGKGAAVRRGMLEARGTIRLFMDADNSTSINQLEKLEPFFQKGYSVVFGSRGLQESIMDPPQGTFRTVMGTLSNLIIQAVNLPGVKDSQCGFKAYTNRAAEYLFGKSREKGWGFDIELLALARSKGYRTKEVPIRWVDKAGSTLRPDAYLKVFVENLRIRWNIIRGSYQ